MNNEQIKFIEGKADGLAATSIVRRHDGFDVVVKDAGKLQLDYGSKPGTAVIKAVDVDEDKQRRGVATALYQKAKEELVLRGVTKLVGSLEGSGPVQLREKVFGPGNTKYFHGGSEVTAAEAIHVMDVEFGYVRAETTIPDSIANKACGKSFIGEEMECHIGETAPTKDARLI